VCLEDDIQSVLGYFVAEASGKSHGGQAILGRIFGFEAPQSILFTPNLART
jgi:hypothetical protein